MSELLEKYEEALFRLNRLDVVLDLNLKLKKGLKIYRGYISYINEKYPLHNVSEQVIFNALRNNTDGQWGYKIVNDKIDFPVDQEEGVELLEKSQLNETINAINYREKLASFIENFRCDIVFQKILEQSKHIIDKGEKVEFLTEQLFNDDLKSQPKYERLIALIKESISKIEKGENNETPINSRLKLPKGQKVKLIELIDAVSNDQLFRDRETEEPASKKLVISEFERFLNIDLGNFHKILNDALKAKKRSEDRDTYLGRLYRQQQLKIERKIDKDSK